MKPYPKIVLFSFLILFLISSCSPEKPLFNKNTETILPNTDLKVFEDNSAWTPGIGTLVDVSEQTKSASRSIMLSRTDEGVAEATRQVNFRFGSAPRLRVKVYVHDTPAIITLQFSSQPDFQSYFIARIGIHERALQLGWNRIDIYSGEWEKHGDEDWSNTMTGLKIQVEPGDGGLAARVTWDQIVVNPSGVPGVLITFDDGYASTYTKAFQHMASIDAHGTVYVIPDRIGNVPKYLTLEQIQAMDAHGWSIANHSHTHEKQLIYLPLDEIKAQLRDAKRMLDGWGLTKASAHVAYPWGNWDANVLDAMEATGMLTGRTTDYAQHVVWAAEGRNYVIGTRMVEVFNDLEEVKGWVDEAVANERIVGLCFHHLVDEDKEDYQWLTDDFTALIDYINEQQIPFLTINDYYALSITGMLPVNDRYTIKPDEDLMVSAPGVVGNDYFLEEVDYSVHLDHQTPPENGHLLLYEDGSFRYSPPGGWSGSFQFAYRLCAAQACTEPATVTIEVLEP